MTRRDFLSSMLPSRWGARPAAIVPAHEPDSSTVDAPRVAVIAGRHCLAYQGSFCSTCRERCPIEGAIVIERGLPRVNADLCNGCGICHDLCPSPVNAVLLVAQASSLRPNRQAGSLHHADHA